jgi:hypothetical protein
MSHGCRTLACTAGIATDFGLGRAALPRQRPARFTAYNSGSHRRLRADGGQSSGSGPARRRGSRRQRGAGRRAGAAQRSNRCIPRQRRSQGGAPEVKDNTITGWWKSLATTRRCRAADSLSSNLVGMPDRMTGEARSHAADFPVQHRISREQTWSLPKIRQGPSAAKA